MGVAEQANQALEGQTRVIIGRIEDRCHVEIPASSPLIGWAVRHSGWTLTRFQEHASGHCSFFFIRGKEYKGEIVCFLECVLAKDPKLSQAKLEKRWIKVLWLGKTHNSDEHISIGRAPCRERG